MPIQIIRPAAYAWIVEGQQVLLCRLSETVHQGHWTLPGGGLDFGEDPALGCQREVWEETGLEVALGPVLLVDSLTLPIAPEVAQRESLRLHNISAWEGTMQSIRIVYRATVVGGELKNEAEGSTDLATWVPLATLPELAQVELVERAWQTWTQ